MTLVGNDSLDTHLGCLVLFLKAPALPRVTLNSIDKVMALDHRCVRYEAETEGGATLEVPTHNAPPPRRTWLHLTRTHPSRSETPLRRGLRRRRSGASNGGV